MTLPWGKVEVVWLPFAYLTNISVRFTDMTPVLVAIMVPVLPAGEQDADKMNSSCGREVGGDGGRGVVWVFKDSTK